MHTRNASKAFRPLCLVKCVLTLQTACEQTVDKYVLFDPVIILLDALLHKPCVYRHLLYNVTVPVSFYTMYLLFNSNHTSKILTWPPSCAIASWLFD